MMLDGADLSLMPRAVQVDLQKVGAFLNQLITAMCWRDRGKLVLVKVHPQSLTRHSTHMHESQLLSCIYMRHARFSRFHSVHKCIEIAVTRVLSEHVHTIFST